MQLENGEGGGSSSSLQNQINNIDRRLAQVEDIPVAAEQGIQQMLRNTDHGHSWFTWLQNADGSFPERSSGGLTASQAMARSL